MPKKQKPVCPACGARNSWYRVKTDELVCRTCGYIGKRKEFFEEENPKETSKR